MVHSGKSIRLCGHEHGKGRWLGQLPSRREDAHQYARAGGQCTGIQCHRSALLPAEGQPGWSSVLEGKRSQHSFAALPETSPPVRWVHNIHAAHTQWPLSQSYHMPLMPETH